MTRFIKMTLPHQIPSVMKTLLILIISLLPLLYAATQDQQLEAHAFVLEGAALHPTDPDRAEALYDDALRLDPYNADALHLKGLARHGAGDSEAGAALIGRAIEARGGGQDTATMWSNLGEVHRHAFRGGFKPRPLGIPAESLHARFQLCL